LASVGATAPFVGLLGTVIGIYRALIKIGLAGQASIDAVAGPVGEALIMTAIGLFVAVPAVLAYNWLQARNRKIERDLSTFANDVLGYMASDGKVKPVMAAPAKAAAPAAAPKK
jgi:biopolymer transport protein ExbB